MRDIQWDWGETRFGCDGYKKMIGKVWGGVGSNHLRVMVKFCVLTSSCTRPGLAILENFTRWKTSTTPSVFNLSSSEYMVMNVPVRPTPSR